MVSEAGAFSRVSLQALKQKQRSMGSAGGVAGKAMKQS
jgi:hypothetical protein